MRFCQVLAQTRREKGLKAVETKIIKIFDKKSRFKVHVLNEIKIHGSQIAGSKQKFQLEVVAQYLPILAKALHPRVIALGTCKLSLLEPELVQRIATLSFYS